MNCAICRQEFVEDDRLVANIMHVFTFKPAGVKDAPGINPAELSPEELAESRKAHKRTAVATMFLTYKKDVLPEGVFNVHHADCGVLPTGSARGSGNFFKKHQIRYSRGPRR